MCLKEEKIFKEHKQWICYAASWETCAWIPSIVAWKIDQIHYMKIIKSSWDLKPLCNLWGFSLLFFYMTTIGVITDNAFDFEVEVFQGYEVSYLLNLGAVSATTYKKCDFSSSSWSFYWEAAHPSTSYDPQNLWGINDS